MRDVRITVIKKAFDRDLVERYVAPQRAKALGPCGLGVGDSFVVSQPVMCPEGLCPWAWHDIESFVRIAAFEGKIEEQNPPDSWVRCCTDAYRPVTFLIEPI